VSTKSDYDPFEEQVWLDTQEASVLEYLDNESIPHKDVLDLGWCLAPHVAVWSLPSRSKKSCLTWVICGDLPTDYLLDEKVKDARSAVRAFASRWTEVSKFMIRGKQHPTIRIGEGATQEELQELGELLQLRAQLLLKWVEDESIWSL
jgi:hypothetical protein